MQTLNSRLYVRDSRGRQHIHLLSIKIGLDFVEELQVYILFGQLGQKVRECSGVHYVVDCFKEQDLVLVRLFQNLIDYPLWRLGPVLHGLALQAAERAMSLFSPPAASRTLKKQRYIDMMDQACF